MTVGTGDKKKVIFLSVLGVVALYMVYSNLLSGPSVPTSSSSHTTSAATPDATTTITASQSEAAAPARSERRATHGRTDDFLPVLHAKRPEDRIDPYKIDPTLRLDLLAKVQDVQLAVGGRNLFQMSTAPPPKPTELAALGKQEPKIFVPIGPKQPPPPPVKPPDLPPPPPTYKFYGYSTLKSTGKKTAYFLDGEDILIAAEGETIKTATKPGLAPVERHYKVVRINTNSVLLEDTQSKRQSTLPLTEDTTQS